MLVELNGAALFPREFANTVLQEGDRLELLRMVAGG
jgi:thiamine biosynthesis protein ThiS